MSAYIYICTHNIYIYTFTYMCVHLYIYLGVSSGTNEMRIHKNKITITIKTKMNIVCIHTLGVDSGTYGEKKKGYATTNGVGREQDGLSLNLFSGKV